MTAEKKNSPAKKKEEEKPAAKSKTSAEKTVAKKTETKIVPATKTAPAPEKKKTTAPAAAKEKTEPPKGDDVSEGKKAEKAEEKVEKAEEKKAPAADVKKKVKKEKKEKPIEKIAFLAKEEGTVEGRKKKPAFIRQEYYKLPRLKAVWRKPRGIDSKQHEGKKGKPASPDIGYGSPEEIRGMHYSGYFPVVVNTIADINKINPQKQAAVIASSIGRLKRNEIIKAANAKKIIILNPRKGETQ